MDGPGDGCRDIQSFDKDGVKVLTQCKYVANFDKTIGSPDANEIIVALAKFGGKRGILATTGRFSPQLKREFTDNFPELHLDWIDGADIVDEIFSNPILHRAWVSERSIGRETIFLKIPFIIRRALNDEPFEVHNKDLGDGISIEASCLIDRRSLEPFRPPQTVNWNELDGPFLSCAALLSQSPPDLHALEELHIETAEKLLANVGEVVTIRFGLPYMVPTKTPAFEKGFSIPGFSPRSYVVSPNHVALFEQDYLILSSPSWRWPEHLSMAEGDWGNWQNHDNQRWCHVEVANPAFLNSPQSRICRMIGNSKRRELLDAQAIFVTATSEVCLRILAKCSIEPDVQCANGPGGELLGWTFCPYSERTIDRETLLKIVHEESSIEFVDVEEAIHITARSDDPLVPSPADEIYYPAQLVWDYEHLPSPQYLKGRTLAFIEFWWVPADVDTGANLLKSMEFALPPDWRIFIDCKRGPTTKQTFPMISVSVPNSLDLTTSELVEKVNSRVDGVFEGIASTLKKTWPDARCATSEFWEKEITFPAGMYVSTSEGFVLTDWSPEEVEEGDD